LFADIQNCQKVIDAESGISADKIQNAVMDTAKPVLRQHGIRSGNYGAECKMQSLQCIVEFLLSFR